MCSLIVRSFVPFCFGAMLLSRVLFCPVLFGSCAVFTRAVLAFRCLVACCFVLYCLDAVLFRHVLFCPCSFDAVLFSTVLFWHCAF